MGRRRGDAILMGEVNLPPDQQRAFFGDEAGDELHMALSFVLNQAITWPWRAATRRPCARRWRRCPRSPRTASGPTSSATTTS
jgi:maltose alpha-D-glucosyltransferase/alpha-amylase